MNNFTYHRAASVQDAIKLAQLPHAKFIAGGTNLLDLMKGAVEQPQVLIDVGPLQLTRIEALDTGGVRIGAGVSNTELANHPLIRRNYPLLAQAIVAGASPQLRNMATVGGNLLQRTRCHYFYDVAYDACNKRSPNSGCAALAGQNRQHAILGGSEQCIATNPSDMNVALAALNASVQVQGAQQTRRIAIQDFHRLPGAQPQLDSTLAAGELIVAVELPRSPFAQHCTYLKVRDRASYAFALISVAAGLDMQGETVRDATLVLGGVAHKPWRVPAAEQALIGKPLTAQSMQQAAALLVAGAQPHTHNAFKVTLAQRSVIRALTQAAHTAVV